MKPYTATQVMEGQKQAEVATLKVVAAGLRCQDAVLTGCLSIHPEPDLISTGAAAKSLGYSVAGFRRKFLAAFLAQHAVIRQPDGHWRWSRALVEHLHNRNATPKES